MEPDDGKSGLGFHGAYNPPHAAGLDTGGCREPAAEAQKVPPRIAPEPGVLPHRERFFSHVALLDGSLVNDSARELKLSAW
jgi:hypothetical protein